MMKTDIIAAARNEVLLFKLSSSLASLNGLNWNSDHFHVTGQSHYTCVAAGYGGVVRPRSCHSASNGAYQRPEVEST